MANLSKRMKVKNKTRVIFTRTKQFVIGSETIVLKVLGSAADATKGKHNNAKDNIFFIMIKIAEFKGK